MTMAGDSLKSVVMITIDSLRPDHTSIYGYHRDTTPFLRSLTNKFKIYRTAYANGSHTASSFVSSFTSTYPLMFAPSNLNTPNLWRKILKQKITLPEILSKYNYETIAFNTNPYLSKYQLGLTTRFNKVFELLPGITIKSEKTGNKKKAQLSFTKLRSIFRKFGNYIKMRNFSLYAFLRTKYHKYIELSRQYLSAGEVNLYIKKYLLSGNFNWKKKFIWIHYMDTHVPYVPPEKYLRLYNKKLSIYESPVINHYFYLKYILGIKTIKWTDETELIKRTIDFYDASIRYLDDQLKELFKVFEDSGMPDDTIIIIFSDHGDEHLEHGNYTHGYSLYEEVVKILFMMYDGNKAGFFNERVQLLDLVPHILSLLGIKKPRQMMGCKLTEPEYIFMETAFKSACKQFVILRGVIKENYKFIYNETFNKFELYDLINDPFERNDLSKYNKNLTKQFFNILNSIKIRNKRLELSIKLNKLIAR